MKSKVLFFYFFLILSCFGVEDIFSQTDTENSAACLIVINVQDHFTNDVLPPEKSAPVIGKINEIIGQTAPDEIIYVKSLVRVLSLTSDGTKVDTLPGMDFDKRLELINDEIFTKTKPDMFTCEELTSFLKSKRIKSITVVGFMANHSVYQSCLGALKNGYKVSLIPDATLAGEEDDFNEIIGKLEKKGVMIQDR